MYLFRLVFPFSHWSVVWARLAVISWYSGGVGLPYPFLRYSSILSGVAIPIEKSIWGCFTRRSSIVFIIFDSIKSETSSPRLFPPIGLSFLNKRYLFEELVLRRSAKLFEINSIATLFRWSIGPAFPSNGLEGIIVSFPSWTFIPIRPFSKLVFPPPF